MPTAQIGVFVKFKLSIVGQGPNPAVMLAQIKGSIVGAIHESPVNLTQTKKLCTNQKSLPLEGKVGFAEQNSDEVESQITHNLAELYNDCFAIYTSPPPTAEPLLKEKP